MGMNRGSLARRYLPLALVAAVQLLIIAVIPSTAPKEQVSAGGTAGNFATGPGVGTGTGATSTGGGTGIAGTSTGGTGGGTGTSTSGGAGTSTSGGGNLGVAGKGDTTHCVGGREFDPGLAYWAPPCVAGTPGAAYASNGGATYAGVTGDTITIVDNVPEYGAEVNAINKAKGDYLSYLAAQVIDKAYQNFINSHYVLYGRKVKIITHDDECTDVPPDYNCLIPEMDRLIDTYHPFMLYFGTPLCSACFQEIARRHVVGTGGSGFSDELLDANAPYMYGNRESSNRIETQFAQWWCNQMSSKNVPSRTVKFAGHQNKSQDFNGKPRVLGVISTNDPDNESTVKNVLYKQLAALCGETVTHEYFYAQDINTAAKQVAAGIAALDTPTNPATTVLCLCDTVAPAFLYDGEQGANYYPENVIATDQDMDLDSVAQAYGPTPLGRASLGCPSPNIGCEFDLAFGLGMRGPQQPQENDEGIRILKAGGLKQLPPSLTAINATLIAQDYVQMANLLEAAGPNLTPQAMYAAAPGMGSVGGGATNQPLLSYAAKTFGWFQDVRLVYWSRNKVSSYNHKPGTFVQFEGGRMDLGQFPVLRDGPPIPAQR
jgi:hypothetical protein